jgi:hypothetical protein
MDGINVADTDVFTIKAGASKQFTFGIAHKYVRIVYTNGASAQSSFGLQTLLHKTAPKPSSHRLQDSIVDDDDVELVKSVLSGKTAQGNYINFQATNAGNFKVSLEEVNGVKVPITSSDSSLFDAFGSLRTSSNGNRYDVEFIYDKQSNLVDEVTVSGGTATHNASSRDVTLAIANTTTGTEAALYSRIDIPYTAGNSQLIEVTGTLDNAAIGGGTAYLFIRSSVSGSLQETAIAQSNWHYNPGDFDWSKSQIFRMDFQSLKVGRIRFDFIRNGLAVKVHEIYNDNVRNTGFWQTPTLPQYWRIYNDATYTYMEMGYGDTNNAIGLRYRIAKNASATMRAICGTVKSEGSSGIFQMPGLNRSIDNGTTPKTVSTTLIPLLSIRPSATFNSIANRGLYIPNEYSIVGTNPMRYVILYRPVLTGASWVAVDAVNSGMEYDVTASAVTGGIVVDSDYFSTNRNSESRSDGLLERAILSLGRTGVADILTIAAIRTSTSDSSTYSAMKWKEIR